MAYRIEYDKAASAEQQSEFEAALKAARAKATKKKNNKERGWFSLPGGEDVNDEGWFKTHYNTAGRWIGQRRRLELVMQKLRDDPRYQVQKNDGTWEVIESESSTPLCTVSVYIPKNEDITNVGNTPRAVYKINNKEYVIDDIGVPTRRFAYCVRMGNNEGDAPVLKEIDKSKLKPGQSKVKFKNETWKEAMKGAFDALKTKDRSQWHSLSDETKICLAYLNYAYDGCAGVCLSSTPKRIRDNEGKAFLRKEGHFVWKVDLAKVPTDAVLINIYGRDLPLKYEEGEDKDLKTLLWIAQGTVKNRELFCSDVPSAAAKKMNASAAMLEAENWSWKNFDEFFSEG